jgi:sugar phosphate permease
MQQPQEQQTQSPPRGKLFYGWWIVIIGCIQDAVKGGTYNTGFTLYFLPVLNELHLSRAAMSLPFSLAKLESAIQGPLVGYLIDRFDLRVMMVIGTTLAGLGFVLLAFTHSYATFLLVFMGLLSVGFQTGFNQATMSAVNYWFYKKRGLAMSITQTGQAVGGVIFLPLVAWTVLKHGWRTAALMSGIVVLCLLPLVLLIRRTPESMGLLPDGEPHLPPPPASTASKPPHFYIDTGDFTPREALRTPAFWLLALFHGLRNVPYNGVSVHLVPLLVWKGVDEPTAAFFVSLMAFITILIRPLTGWLGDWWSKQNIGALGVLIAALGLVVLAYGNGTFWHLAIFVVLFAFGDAINSVTWALVGDFFGRKQFATIRGWIGMLQSLVAMPTAIVTGWVYDRTQSYVYVLIPFIAVYVVAALVLWQASRPRRPKPVVFAPDTSP